MGNNRIYLKMLVSSIIFLFIIFLLTNIFDFNDTALTIIFGLATIYTFTTTILWRLASVYQDLFYTYDKKYYINFGRKLVLSKNDKYILKHIIYTVHDRKKHETFINAFKTNNKTEINNYLLRNNYKINDMNTFNNVVELISEHINSKSFL